MKILKGLGAAEGIAFAKAFVLKTNKFSGNRTSITEDKIPSEIEALKIALAKSKDEVASLQKKAYADGADEQGDVFGAYMEILDDEQAVGALRRAKNAEDLAVIFDSVEEI